MLPSSNPSPLVSWFEPEESSTAGFESPVQNGSVPTAHASARHEAGHNLTTPYHLPCRSWPQSHSMSAQSLQRASAVWRITEQRRVRFAARERIWAASMRARASRMAAAGREHAESLTSPLFATIPLDECSLTSICGMASTEHRGVRLSACGTVRATSMRARASRMTAASREGAGSPRRRSWDAMPQRVREARYEEGCRTGAARSLICDMI